MAERIEARKPLVHGRGDPLAQDIEQLQARDLEVDVVAPFVTPEPLVEHDVIVHPISGSQSMGDPLDRDPAAVREDLERGWTRPRTARTLPAPGARSG